MFTLAHFSDPHLGPLPPARARELCGQRLLGYLSWHRRRKFIHDPSVLALLADDIAALAPDHVAITGDLANISLPDEFENVRAWLATLGPPDRVSVVPGNHDAYVPMAWERSIGRWAAYFSSDDDAPQVPLAATGPAAFPFVRRRGPIAVVGVSTACPSPPTFATGRIGAEQLRRLGTVLGALGHGTTFRVVLLHHPPHDKGASWRKHLNDAADFRACIAQYGAELILHGHNHKFVRAEIAGPDHAVPVFGVPSASAARAGHKPQSHYNLYRIDKAGAGWRIGLETRGYRAERRDFRTVATDTIELPATTRRRAPRSGPV